MTPLGESLVFYLKHMAEMNRLYIDLDEGEERDLTRLEDSEHVLQMARTVGDEAYKQVTDFLELCGKKIKNHFTGLGIAKVDNITNRTTVVNNWHWRGRVKVPSACDGLFYGGVQITAPPEVRISLEKDVFGIVVPWLEARGGQKSKDKVRSILGGWPFSRATADLSQRLAKGVLDLPYVRVKAQPADSFDVDRDQLVAEVTKIFTRIGAEQTKAIASLVAGVKEGDEG